MKNLIVFLLLLTKVSVAEAFTLWQYELSITGPTSGSYTCLITPDVSWVQDDLITWIFPDGQMQQSEIQNNNSTITGDVITWSPCYHTTVDLNQIQVYVARKGGTGTPPPLSFVTPTSNLSSSAPATATTPAGIDFPPGKNWKVEKSWEFSPGNATFLVFSYKQSGTGCSNSSVEITLPSGITEAGSLDFFGEDNQVISTSERKIWISSYSLNHRNYFLKLHTNSSIQAGQTIDIYIKGGFCSPTFVDTLRFVVETEPHDPNYKKVDIDTIYNGHTNALRLTYTIQFHNDGNGPVKKVVVKDEIPDGLNPATFHLVDAPAMNGLALSNQTDFQNLYSSNHFKEIIFEGAADGLPGINETGPSYAYDQTIYRFKYAIDTDPNFKSTINNDAEIIFYNGSESLPSIVTEVAPVHIVDEKAPVPTNVSGCCCDWQPCWCRFFNIFRREKLRPCK